jgi:hypothetical protein
MGAGSVFCAVSRWWLGRLVSRHVIYGLSRVLLVDVRKREILPTTLALHRPTKRSTHGLPDQFRYVLMGYSCRYRHQLNFLLAESDRDNPPLGLALWQPWSSDFLSVLLLCQA